MALTARYANFDLATGSNDGTSEANAWQTWAAMAAGYAAGDKVYFKQTASRHDAGGLVTMSTAPGAATPVVLEGYKTTPGDGGDAGEANYFQFSNQISIPRGMYLKFFDVEGQPSTAGGYLVAHTGNVTFFRCRFKNTRTDATVSTLVLDDEGSALNCTIVAPQNEYAIEVSDAGLAYGCRLDATATGAGGAEITHTALQYQYVLYCTIVGNGTGAGIKSQTFSAAALSKYRLIYKNSIYNVGNGIDFSGVDLAGSATHDIIMGNVIWGCTNGIINQGVNTAAVQVLWNAIGNASSNRYSGFGDNITWVGDVTLTANPFNDPDNWDFRIASTNVLAGSFLPNLAGLGTTTNAENFGAVEATV